MKIVFCGTPDYAVPSLRTLWRLAPRHEVVAVVSQPDRPKGRSGTPTPPPVVIGAREMGLPAERILQPKSINRRDVLECLRALQPDLLCVIAYGKLLKADALALPRRMPLNAHGSLLPRHRGAAPIQAALLAGDAQTGVTIMKMAEGLDAGPWLLRRSLPIQPNDDAGTLHDKLAALSAQCFVEAIERLESGSDTLTPQDEQQASYAQKLHKDSGKVDWRRDAQFLERFVRAMNPWPGAWTTAASPGDARRQRLRIVRCSVAAQMPQAMTPGQGAVQTLDGDASIVVACSQGALEIHEVQPEGKRVMSAAEFLRGAGRKLVPASQWE